MREMGENVMRLSMLQRLSRLSSIGATWAASGRTWRLRTAGIEIERNAPGELVAPGELTAYSTLSTECLKRISREAVVPGVTDRKKEDA